MIKKLTLLLTSALLLAYNVSAQQIGQGFTSVTNLSPEPTSTNTGEKPQSKPWQYDGKWWAVFPNSAGTHLWRLDGTKWIDVLRLSPRTTSKADCKVVGNVTHILLYQGASSQMASVEYTAGAYKLWSRRTSTVGLTLDKGVETATIDIDSQGRMWLASAGVSDINVRWSDAPYTNWSAPITIATGVDDDDICAVIALPGKIGVLWSNQVTRRFGFKTHVDGASPGDWSADEVPASQSALNVGNGMADDHLNMALASDGTLYCAVKTEYGARGYPEVALLVRRPTGTWHNLYEVSEIGTRPIVILNEAQGRLKVIYTSNNSGGNILYRETATTNISFGPQMTLLSGNFNNSTSSKDNYTSDVVVLASSNTQVVGVLATDGTATAAPNAPLLASPANNATEVSLSPTLTWNASPRANSYQVQVATSSSFSSTVFNQSGIQTTSASANGLASNTHYYWRARATNETGTSAWSSIWSFTTEGSTVEQYTLSVSAGSGGSVTRSPDQSTYASGSTVSLTANPATGYQFAGWSGDASGTANPLSVKMDKDKTLTASFTAISSGPQVTGFTLINAANEQDLRPLRDGDVVSLADLPSSKLNIRANTSPSSVGSVKFELSGAQSLTYADNAPPYALHGDDGRGNYYYGNWNPPALGTYTLKATPYSGAKGTGTAGIPMTISFTVVEKAGTPPSEQYTLSLTQTTGGTITANPSQASYAAGSTVSLTATPATGYRFVNWSGGVSGSVNPLSISMTSNTSVSAVFETTTTEGPMVTGFTLIAANTDTDIRPITDGQTINLGELPSAKLTIRANTNPTAVGSVRLELSGPQSRDYTDNNTPYSLFGDDGAANYYFGTWGPPTTGTYTLKATPYVEAGAKGAAGTPLTITFTFTSTSLASTSSSSLQGAALHEGRFTAYPNPFSSKAFLNFSLAEDGEYSLTLLDARGAQVATIRQGKASAGEMNSVEVDGSGLPKGLYFVRLQAKDKIQTLKLILDR